MKKCRKITAHLNGKMENDLLFSVYYLLLSESTPPSTTRLKLLYPKRGPVFLILLVYHVGSPRSTLAPLTKCTRLYSKLNYFYQVFYTLALLTKCIRLHSKLNYLYRVFLFFRSLHQHVRFNEIFMNHSLNKEVGYHPKLLFGDQYSISDTLTRRPGDNKKSLMRSSTNPQEYYVKPSMVFELPPLGLG